MLMKRGEDIGVVDCLECEMSSHQLEGREGCGLVEILYGPEELLMKYSKRV